MRRNRVEHFQGHDLDDRFPSGSRAVDAFCADLARPSQFDTARIETLAAELAAEASASTPPNQHGDEFGRRRRPLQPRWRRRATLTALMSSMIAKVAFATVAVATTTGGLAATGNLPEPAQRVVSEVASLVGIDVPMPSSMLPVPDPQADPQADPQGEAPGRPAFGEAQAEHTLPEQASERARWVFEAALDDEGDEIVPGPGLGKRISEIASQGRAGGSASDGNRPEGRGRPEAPGNKPPAPPGQSNP